MHHGPNIWAMGRVPKINQPLVPPHYMGAESVKDMTIRQYFVAQAMNGLLSFPNTSNTGQQSKERLIEAAVIWADALLVHEDLTQAELGKRLIEESNREAADLGEIEHAAYVGGRKDAIHEALDAVDDFYSTMLKVECGTFEGGAASAVLELRRQVALLTGKR